VARLAATHNIDTTGLTREQFFEKLSEQLSLEQMHELSESFAEAHLAEFDEFSADLRDWIEDHGEKWNSDEFYGINGPRTLEELEAEYRSEDAARSEEQGADRSGGPGAAGRSAGEGQEGGGPRGRSAGATGRGGEEAAEQQPEPLPALDVRGESRDFRRPEDDAAIKAANIRLDKINSTDAMNDALRQLAAENGDFMDARYGTAAYQTQMDIRNTRILLRSSTAEMMDAAKLAAGGDPAAIADYVTKSQRAALIFDHLSSLSADWAHAGHELRKVMPGFDEAKNIASQIQDLTGRTLFQIQQQAALVSKMDTAEQAAKFASEMVMSRWQRIRAGIISYFVNNLISGPITHMAYGIGNTNIALYKAVPETLVQATIGAIRGGEDRVYYGEAGAQLYGMVRGLRDGIVPAWRAVQSGVPILPETLQGDLLAGMNTRTQAIPGKLGRIIETPSRVVSGIHTLFYTMGYEQEIARLAFRDAAARGLRGDDFNVAVAKATGTPTPEMIQAAHDEALKMVLMQRPVYGGARYHLSKLVNDNLAAKLIMPFMQIGMNILDQGIVERTGLAVLKGEARAELSGARGGAARDLRLGKIATGSMLGAATVGMAIEGLITGGGPVDPKERRILEDTGWKAYSLRVGDTYIPYRKYLGPLGPLVATAADFHEVYHTAHDEGMAEAAKSLAFGFSEVVADETWMMGLANFVDAVRNWDTKGDYYFRNLATSFIPFSSALNQTARLVDPYQRQARNLLDAAKAKIPVVSQTVQPRISIWGQPIRSHMMISPSPAHEDAVDERLIALNHGYAMPERKIRGIELTDKQYNDYAVTAGQLAKHMLDALVATPGFSLLPEGIQTKRMDESVSRARKAARRMVMMKSLGSDNNIPLLAQQNKLKLLQPAH
jgi:hypothetical protein